MIVILSLRNSFIYKVRISRVNIVRKLSA